MSKFYKPIGNKMCVFPVGSVYLTMIKENPSKYYGGTWELISGGYIYATGSNSLGKTTYGGWGAQSGGSGTTGSTTLSIEQIPPHKHYIQAMAGGTQWAYGFIWSRAAGPTDGNSEGGQNNYTNEIGGGKGHNHSIPNHSHNIATIDVFMYKRIA